MRANLNWCEDASAIYFNHSFFRYLSFKTPDTGGLHQAFLFEQYNQKKCKHPRSDVKRVLALICKDFFYADESIRQIAILHIDDKHL